MNLTPQQFSTRLLKWFDHSGRHDLPWQKDITPYRVWVSETMLQQTQVATVIHYFENFTKTFPDIVSLANTKEDNVLHLWTGLGYYSRCRNLHKAAKNIRDEHKGKFPSDFDSIFALPGIGRSTAGAILSIAFQKATPILDGNVRRVLCRLLAIKGWSGDKKIEAQLWKISENYTPQKRVAEYTQAIMDLGATVCKRNKPACFLCPFNDVCQARLQNREQELPHKKPSKTLPIKKTQFIILLNQHHEVLLEKRPPIGIWGGLWSFPEVKLSKKFLFTWCEQQFYCSILQKTKLENFRHTFSHFHLDISPLLVQVKTNTQQIMENDQKIWYKLNQPDKRGLPAPIKKILVELSNVPNTSNGSLPKTQKRR